MMIVLVEVVDASALACCLCQELLSWGSCSQRCCAGRFARDKKPDERNGAVPVVLRVCESNGGDGAFCHAFCVYDAKDGAGNELCSYVNSKQYGASCLVSLWL